MTPDELIEEHGATDALKLDGFDECCIGVVTRFGLEPILCYDFDLVIQALIKQGMTEEQALENFEFNIIGAWVGDGTPCFLTSGQAPA